MIVRESMIWLAKFWPMRVRQLATATPTAPATGTRANVSPTLNAAADTLTTVRKRSFPYTCSMKALYPKETLK